MDDEELRIKIYKRLGLEVGNLLSESGNDWQRAKNEVLEELKQIEFEKLKNTKSTDYLNIAKNSEEFKTVLNSIFMESYNLKNIIAQRNDLTDNEIDKLISFKNKDIIINLSKYQKLNLEQIDKIIPDSVYLVKKNLIEIQVLSEIQKNRIIDMMNKSTLDYKDLIAKIII